MQRMFCEISKDIARHIDSGLPFSPFTKGALVDLLESGSSHFLCSKSPERGIAINSTNGDLLVGFHCSEDVVVTLAVSDVIVSQHVLKAGSFKYAIDDASVLPLICLVFHQVKVSSTGKMPECVYAVLDTPKRKVMAYLGCVYMKRGSDRQICYLYKNGAASIVQSGVLPEDHVLTELPDMQTLIPCTW